MDVERVVPWHSFAAIRCAELLRAPARCVRGFSLLPVERSFPGMGHGASERTSCYCQVVGGFVLWQDLGARLGQWREVEEKFLY